MKKIVKFAMKVMLTFKINAYRVPYKIVNFTIVQILKHNKYANSVRMDMFWWQDVIVVNNLLLKIVI